MRILLVNDDGIESAGLRRLAKELSGRHRVTVVAPSGQRSAASHSLTLRDELSAREVKLVDGVKAWAVDGTPADCTRLALDALCKDAQLVISGPNVGLNVAFDTLYSGTVAAALEGAMHRIPAIAVSAPPHAEEAEVVRAFLRVFSQLDPKRDVHHLLNINIPALPLEQIKGVRWVPQGLYHQWEDHYWAGVPEGGRDVYRVRGEEVPVGKEIADDSSAVLNGCIALTPLSFDLTDRAGFRQKEFEL